jgi:tRNA(fMet)-specific endonuclease VapC
VRCLLDTNIVSEPLKASPDPRVLREIERHSGSLTIASVVWHELLFGAARMPPSAARTLIERYLRDVVAPTMEVLPYDEAAAAWHAAERARLTRAGLTPPFADGQVAATAATHGCVLVTRNVRDFTNFRGLTVRNWFASP